MTRFAVHFERDVFAPGSSYTGSAKVSPQFLVYLAAAGQLGKADDHVTFGYDDVSWIFETQKEAMAFGAAMDKVLPGPKKWYRDSYLSGMEHVHHACITEYEDEECTEVGESYSPDGRR